MPIKIGEKLYPMLNEPGQKGLTGLEQILIEKEFRKPYEKIFMSVTDRQIKAMTPEQKDELEVNRRLAFFVGVWIARLRAGEKISFDAAIDEPNIEMVPLEEGSETLKNFTEAENSKDSMTD